MKRVIFLLLFMTLFFVPSYSQTHIITNSGLTFTPANITINVGDTVKFVLDSIHKPREVDQATWNANGNTSNGGFDMPFGGGTVVITSAGVHYYVCVPHASSGMKGTITANTVTSLESETSSIPTNYYLKQNYPNPFNPGTIIKYGLPLSGKLQLQFLMRSGNKYTSLLMKYNQPVVMKLSLMHPHCPAAYIYTEYLLKIFHKQEK